MKKICLAFITLSLLLVGCKKELPYPIEDVTRGVVIDVTRVAGTDGTLSDGLTTGNYKINLVIPPQQGDYSFMQQAQLLAVLEEPITNADGSTTTKYTTAVVKDNITEFPQEVTIDVADVYAKLGKSTPSVGEVVYFTVNTVLNNGTTVPGWSELFGFNNNAFSAWQVSGRAYSSNVRYAVVCPLVLEDFTGTCTVTTDDWWGETPYTVEVTKVSDTQLSIAGLFNGQATNPLLITIDIEDYSISFEKQVLTPLSGNWWSPARPTYNNFSLASVSGVVDACDTKITFTAAATVDAGSFGNRNFVLGK